MSPRIVAALAAVVSITLVLVQYLAPQWAGFHTWQYSAALAIAGTAVGAYALGARRGEDGERGARLAISALGTLVIIVAGIASGLLGPDSQVIARAPGTVAPLGDVGAAAFFPIADPAAIARGDGHVLLRRRGAAEIDIAPGQRRFVGATAIELVPKIAAYVEARTQAGQHLTITQPTNSAFLSPVLLFSSEVAIAGKTLPSDAFAVPALHRQIKAFYFAKGAPGAAASAHGQAVGGASLLFAVDDDGGRLVPGGIGFAASGQQVDLGGLALRATLGTYPALAISAVPVPQALWVGAVLILGGLGLAFTRIPANVTQRTSGRVA